MDVSFLFIYFFFDSHKGRFTKSGVEIVQSYLQIKGVQWKDAGFYRCRVDFFQAPTRNLKVKLALIGKLCKYRWRNLDLQFQVFS